MGRHGETAPATTATAQAGDKHSTLHDSTGSQQTSQGTIDRHAGSLFGIKCEIRASKNEKAAERKETKK